MEHFSLAGEALINIVTDGSYTGFSLILLHLIFVGQEKNDDKFCYIYAHVQYLPNAMIDYQNGMITP